MKKLLIFGVAIIGLIGSIFYFTNQLYIPQIQNNLKSLECPISTPSWTNKYKTKDNQIAFSTAERELDGLYLQILNNKGEITNRIKEESWNDGGTLGSFTFDKALNIYTIPTPIITIGNNPKDQRQYIYKVDKKTGKMDKWLELPITDDLKNIDEKSYLQNVYGNIGITSDCKNNKLYVSSILGSDRDKMRGKVFEIDIETKSFNPIITDHDCYGLTKFEDKDKSYLLFGNTRETSIGLYEFESKKIKKKETDIIHPNVIKQDHRVKKIRLKNDIFEIGLYPFDYTLATSGENLNSKLEYQYKEGEWGLVKK
jgi:hypothetical protein